VIQGTIVNLQAKINVVLRLAPGQELEIGCVVDTGFSGFLTLPSIAVERLGLPYLININANLADHSSVKTNVHAATIVWNGQERNITVLAMGQRPLIGTALLENQNLSIDFREGGKVTINTLTES
jgi:clan AA aspartic protease